jgi:two-component system, response regulator PdtaR
VEHCGALLVRALWAKEKSTILVIENYALLRLYAVSPLEENGFGVVDATNAVAALELLETCDDVRLLFTDIQMPGSCEGMDLARKVHARWPASFWSSLPVI